jgi:pimeloyl-ACP methyl ester carboxylesterase
MLPSLRIWYDERGVGEPLLLLHGALVDARFFDQNIEALSNRFHVFAPDLRGHGHTADVAGPLTYDAMAQDTIEFLEQIVGGPAHLVGHSMGAGVALHHELRRPDLTRRLALISGAFHHEGQKGTYETDVDELVATFGPAYGEVSPDGEAHFPVVVRKVMDMDLRQPALTPADLNRVAARTLVMSSDHDTVRLEHTVALYQGITDSELAIVPGASHSLLREKPELCNTILLAFLSGDSE